MEGLPSNERSELRRAQDPFIRPYARQAELRLGRSDKRAEANGAVGENALAFDTERNSFGVNRCP